MDRSIAFPKAEQLRQKIAALVENEIKKPLPDEPRALTRKMTLDTNGLTTSPSHLTFGGSKGLVARFERKIKDIDEDELSGYETS
eukprot:m.198404 g.198404  ORF g.198404 m.198404 type:complete len:85 (+) comp32692_c1_seq1:666-920(+)